MSNEKASKSRTLGPISAKFIDTLRNQGKTIFTLAEAVQIYGGNNQQTSKFIRSLVIRGVLGHLVSGKYIIQQSGLEAAQSTNWPIIARELADERDYFISHYSAMRLHGMTTHPLIHVYLTVPKRVRPKTVFGISYHFIFSHSEIFWGVKNQWVSKHEKIMVSDIERTILDGLDRPDLCGGLKDVLLGIWAVQKEVDWEKLLQYAIKYKSIAVVKRLGFILEILDLQKNFIKDLNLLAVKSKSYVLLDPTGVRVGKHMRRWYIQLNIDINELKRSVWG